LATGLRARRLYRPRLRRWSNLGLDLYIYSSGSVDAQKLLFGFSDAGDLRPIFSGYFDTRIGHKREVDSYNAIVESIGSRAHEILFLSDIAEELDAATEAGMQTVQLVRQDDVVVGSHTVATSFDEILLNVRE
jgi:enolase-phosphatase E1